MLMGVLRGEGVTLEPLPPQRTSVIGAARRGVYVCPGMRVPGKSRRKRLADTHPGAKKRIRVEYGLSGTTWGHWDKVLFGGLVIGYELSDFT